MPDNTIDANEVDESPKRKVTPAVQALIDDAVDKAEKNAAMLAIMADLHYPESKDGSTLDLSFFKAIVAWHLVRCGYRPNEEKREIKPRRLLARGVARDAVEWVGVDEPDEIDYTKMTLGEINALPPRQRACAMQAVGGPVNEEDLPENPGWHVKTNISIKDAPDLNEDGYSWTGRNHSK